MQQFKPIPGYPDYEADEAGRIWSRRHRWLGRKQLIPHLQNGYYMVRLAVGPRKRQRVCVHTLVCAAFHGSRPEGHWARHLNGVSVDNAPSNLKWGTPQENIDDRTKHGKHLASCRLRSSTKLTPAKVRKIRRLIQKGVKQTAVATQFHIAKSTVNQVNQRQSWREI